AELNIELGTAYLASLLREFGTAEAALVAYNGGPAFARRVLRNPAARKRFVVGYPRDVLGEWRRLRERQAQAETRRALPGDGRTLAQGRTGTTATAQ
ncbi:MAG: transglycosylase SLT domain-containing protein, partial [Myxococcaceae bacterium]